MKSQKTLVIFLSIILVLSLIFSGYIYSQLKTIIAQRDGLTQEKTSFGKVYDELSKQIKEKDEAPNVAKKSLEYSTYTLLSKCGLGLSYPDETKTYFGEAGSATKGPFSRAWRLSFETIKDDLIFKGGSKYYLSLTNDDQASGYISALINIECIENKEGKTLDEITDKYLKNVRDGNIALESVTGVKASSLPVKKEETMDKWETKVDRLTINKNSIADSYQSEEYILLNKNMIIRISKIAGTGDKKALASVTTILDSIYLY